MATSLRDALVGALAELQDLPAAELVEQRYQRLSSYGVFKAD